jgi:hypothetical protein
MARKRQIDPIYPSEKEIRSLSVPARYFYILSWCHMDDQNGVMPYDIFQLKIQIFPEDQVDVETIIKELIDQRRLWPFRAEGKEWLWCPTLLDHQNIQHPTAKHYPVPTAEVKEEYRKYKTLNEFSHTTHIPLTQSRVELSRVELNKTQPYWAGFNKDTQKTMLDVSKKFNIYQFLGKLKKSKKLELPETVVNRICIGYLITGNKVRATWPWFIVTTKKVWEAWNAEKNIAEGAEYKAKAPLPQSIKDLVAMILKSKDVNVK